MKLPVQGTILVAAFVAISLLLAACGAPPKTASNTSQGAKIEPRTNGTRGGRITYRLTAPPSTLNYLMAKDEAGLTASFFMLMGRLVEFDHSSQKFVPGLAESWTTNDGQTVDVKLRDGLQFSDGHPLTADDVVFTLNAMVDDKVKSPAFRDAMMIDDKPITAKKVSDTQLQFTFPKPVASVENYFVNIGVLPKHLLEADLAAGNLAEDWKVDSDATKIVTSGPFIVTASKPGESIEYARNPHYYKKDSAGTQLPYLDGVTIQVINDPNNTFSQLGQGTLNIADRIRTTDFVELNKANGQVRGYDAGPGLAIDHIFFNENTDGPNGPLGNDTKRAWFTNKNFRKAIASAVDRDTICNVTLQGLATPLYGFVSPANRAWTKSDLPKIDYDLKAAEKMLADAGFKKGGTADAPVLQDATGNNVEFTLLVPAENEPRKNMAAFIQQDLAKLGIKMNVVPVDTPSLNERWQKTYDYDAVLLGLTQTDVEPGSYANFLLSSSAFHQWQPKQKQPSTDWEKRIDDLFTQQSTERDAQKRLAVFNDIQTIFRDEMPVIPLVARHIVTGASSKIGNYNPSPIIPYSLWNVDDLFLKP
ncbi:MAG TPA: ABC transporter substrate-binding protein [Pyrinomonadaceae bacterium]|nr:ABC transporter substrate-binding protein [Pyrinomonadaceae bacterium]